jgi:hypothetical protein
MYRIIDGQAEGIDHLTLDQMEQLAEPLYGTMPGAVRYGGVQATPIRIKGEEVFDGRVWLETGEKVSLGTRWTITDETIRF